MTKLRDKRPQRRTSGATSNSRRGDGFDPKGGVPDYLLRGEARGGDVWLGAALAGLAVTSVVGYFIAEGALGAQPHPLHWLTALMAAVAGGVTAGLGAAFIQARRR